jgi:hypothetical protein
MGYYVTLDFSTVQIPLSAEKAALEAVHRLDTVADHLKQGGSYGNGKTIDKWFSWMPKDLSTITTLQDLLDTLGFRTHVTHDNAIHVDGYENKLGQEELFFFALAPFIQSSIAGNDWFGKMPATMEWTGEDGSKYKWEFQDGKMSVSEAMIHWDGPTIVQYDWQDQLYGVAKA